MTIALLFRGSLKHLGEMAKQFYVCSCYFSHNIFVRRYTLHCAYENDEQFREHYREILRERGCSTEQLYQDVLAEVHTEVERRRESSKQSFLRTQLIKQKYERYHPEVYTLSESFLHREFVEIVKYCCSSTATQDGLLELIKEDVPNVFSFPVLTEEYCSMLLEELDHFEKSDLPKGRPNTMNNYGVLLSELGFNEGLVDRLRENYLMPIAQLLYPEWVGEGLDSHRAFTVSYAKEGDLDLAYHYDNAEVTLNICLGRSFKGGALYFGPMKGEPGSLHRWSSQHRVGCGILHRARQMHEAQIITDGERHNLIIWMRSSSIRNKHCPMCDRPPSLVKSETSGDGFTADCFMEERSCTTL